jgi:hypothetical protein
MASGNQIVSVACPKGNHFFQNVASPGHLTGLILLDKKTLGCTDYLIKKNKSVVSAISD